jgi:hypothetical protein
MKLEIRNIKRATSLAPLGAQKNGENGIGQKAGFALVQRFAENEPALGTRLLGERSELALKRVKEGCMGTVRLAVENECPEGTPIGSPYGCNGHLQAYLRREVKDFEIVDKEYVKPGFSDTLLIRATVRLSRCAGWLGLLC